MTALVYAGGKKKKGAFSPIVVISSARGNSPQCIVLPLVTGTATIGSTVTVSQGTWLNTPGTFYYQWQRNLSDIPGAIFTTYALQSADLSQSITCLVTAWNNFGVGTARTLPFIPIAGSPPATINAPTYALHTAPGFSPPTWDVTGDSTFQPGMWVHQQFASDSGFTTALTDYYTEVQGQDWEASSENIGGGASVGIAGASQSFIPPSGTYFTRCSFETLPGDPANNTVSAWSNTVTDTINVTTTVLDVGKKFVGAIINTSPLYGANLENTGDDAGAAEPVGTTASIPVGAKYYSEHHITSLGHGVGMGIADGTFDFVHTENTPGDVGKGAGVNKDGNITPSAAHFITRAVNDMLQMCVKRTSTSSVTVWIGKNNTWANGDPSAETGGETVTLNADGGGTHCYGYVFTDVSTDVLDSNFGQVAFTYTKPTGSTAWS